MAGPQAAGPISGVDGRLGSRTRHVGHDVLRASEAARREGRERKDDEVVFRRCVTRAGPAAGLLSLMCSEGLSTAGGEEGAIVGRSENERTYGASVLAGRGTRAAFLRFGRARRPLSAMSGGQ